jgi:hypothetical protein
MATENTLFLPISKNNLTGTTSPVEWQSVDVADTVPVSTRVIAVLNSTAKTIPVLMDALGAAVPPAGSSSAGAIPVLGPDGRLPLDVLPDSIMGSMNYRGIIDPTISGSGGSNNLENVSLFNLGPTSLSNKGYYYIISGIGGNGKTVILSGTPTASQIVCANGEAGDLYQDGDWLVSNGIGTWKKIDRTVSNEPIPDSNPTFSGTITNLSIKSGAITDTHLETGSPTAGVQNTKLRHVSIDTIKGRLTDTSVTGTGAVNDITLDGLTNRIGSNSTQYLTVTSQSQVITIQPRWKTVLIDITGSSVTAFTVQFAPVGNNLGSESQTAVYQVSVVSSGTSAPGVAITFRIGAAGLQNPGTGCGVYNIVVGAASIVPYRTSSPRKLANNFPGTGDVLLANSGTDWSWGKVGKANVNNQQVVTYTTGLAVPATPTSTGVQGEIVYDTNFLYICVATNTWRRAPLNATWITAP